MENYNRDIEKLRRSLRTYETTLRNLAELPHERPISEYATRSITSSIFSIKSRISALETLQNATAEHEGWNRLTEAILQKEGVS